MNEGKTELVFFRKNGPAPLVKIKLHGKIITPSKVVKYLGVYIDEFLSGEYHCQELVKKLNRANGMLAKARHYVPHADLKNIYYAIFASHLLYAAQVWTPKLLSVTDKISTLQKNAMRIMTFSEFRAHSEPLFKNLEILKLVDSITLNNCIFVHDYLHGHLPQCYINTFTRIDSKHSVDTRQASTGMLINPRCNTVTFGIKSIYKKCIFSWNKLTADINYMQKSKVVNKLKTIDVDFVQLSRNKLKETITTHLLSTYDD